MDKVGGGAQMRPDSQPVQTVGLVQALYAKEPHLPTHCEPTEWPCSAWLQLSSYSIGAATREERFSQLQSRLRKHLTAMPESLVVFEDFDRMSCELRDMLRDVRCTAISACYSLPDALGISHVRLSPLPHAYALVLAVTEAA
jgi:hypothetical protein